MRNEITLGKEKESQWLGVCRGLADHFDIDVSLVRLAFVLFTLGGGSGGLLYVIAWIVMPYHPEDRKEK